MSQRLEHPPSSRDVVPEHFQAAWKAGEEPWEAFLVHPELGKQRHSRGMWGGVVFPWLLQHMGSSGEEGAATPDAPQALWESPREERGAPEHPEFKGRSLKIWLCCSQPAVPLLQQPSPHFSEGAPELRLLWWLPCAPTLGSTHRDWYPPCSTTGVQWVQGTGDFPPDDTPGLALGSIWGWLDTLSARKGRGVTVLR